jgi:hypothetical protein
LGAKSGLLDLESFRMVLQTELFAREESINAVWKELGQASGSL